MQCPSCKSACSDNIRFCLHCGQYLGEPDEGTRVHSRQRPPTTIRANFPPPAIQSDPIYEPPRKRRWPLYVAAACLASIGLMVIGGLIAGAIVRDGEAPQRREVVALVTPSPLRATPTERPTLQLATPTPIVVRTPAAATTPVLVERVPETTYQPTPVPRDAPIENNELPVVLNWSGELRDGAWRSWNVPAGVFKLELTASDDGVTVEWLNSSCAKTRPIATVRMTCTMNGDGQMVVSNPTVFGMGKSSSVTVKIYRLR